LAKISKPHSDKSTTKKSQHPKAGEVEPSLDARQTVDRVVRTEFRQEQHWNAPILPPNIIKQYDDAVPNGAERLFSQFESESNHRRSMEQRGLELQGRDLWLGKLLALLFAWSVLGLAGFAIYKDALWIAALLGGGMIGTIIFGFLRIFGDKEPNQPKSDPK
jgi:uncharacterized membrane protein